MTKALRRIWDDGPMYFVYAVVAYFAFLAFDIGERVPSFDSIGAQVERFEAPAAGSTTPPTVIDTGALDIRVTSLRARPDGGQIMLTVTLEVDNTTGQNVRFRPDALVLKGSNGTEATLEAGPKAPMTIAPHVAQLTPLTFALPVGTRGPFTLQYAGNELFSGYSV